MLFVFVNDVVIWLLWFGLEVNVFFGWGCVIVVSGLVVCFYVVVLMVS